MHRKEGDLSEAYKIMDQSRRRNARGVENSSCKTRTSLRTSFLCNALFQPPLIANGGEE